MKQFWKSKTLWINFLAMLALIAQLGWGFVFDAEAQLAILGAVNLFVRFKTDESVGK